MPTATDDVEHARQDAWAEYAERLKGLEGADYDLAEEEAWDQLQSSLHALQEASRLSDPPIG